MTQNLLNERSKTHGNFKDVALTTQSALDTFRQGKNYSKLSPMQREALHMLCTKLARIVNGDSTFKDHWEDIAGYATLVMGEIDEIPNS